MINLSSYLKEQYGVIKKHNIQKAENYKILRQYLENSNCFRADCVQGVDKFYLEFEDYGFLVVSINTDSGKVLIGKERFYYSIYEDAETLMEAFSSFLKKHIDRHMLNVITEQN